MILSGCITGPDNERQKNMKRTIIFTDSGDTIIDEATQVYDDRHIVQRADFIPGAKETMDYLEKEGYRIALVADGEWESFQNVYRENGCGHWFEKWIVSEVVGEQKPSQKMFNTALLEMGLKEEDKPNIVMIGNNIRKDVAGANEFGITSIWLDWSPRYFHTVEKPIEQADYVIKTPDELIGIIEKLEKENR